MNDINTPAELIEALDGPNRTLPYWMTYHSVALTKGNIRINMTVRSNPEEITNYRDFPVTEEETVKFVTWLSSL